MTKQHLGVLCMLEPQPVSRYELGHGSQCVNHFSFVVCHPGSAVEAPNLQGKKKKNKKNQPSTLVYSYGNSSRSRPCGSILHSHAP